MKIVISSGGRFHAIHLARQLDKHDSLLKLFSFSYTHKDREALSPKKVHNIFLCKIFDFLFLKLRLSRIINRSKFNYLKDNLFDYFVSKQLSKLEEFDIFIGWANYAKKSIQVARSKGAIIVIESGSNHVLEQKKLLEEEYKTWGINYPPTHSAIIKKITNEFAQADYIMTLSTESRNSFIKQGVPEHKVLQVPCGTDVGFFLDVGRPPLHPPRNPPRKKFRVIFVGLVCIRKGVPYILEAWRQANLPEATTELILVGAMQKDIAQLLPKLSLKKNVIFYGPTGRETLKNLYYQSSIFVLPSIEEGLSMVIGEAMACGLPVICTPNSGAPDLIENGTHGFIIPPRDSLALAEKISWCYEHKDLCYSMGQAGKKRIGDFTWDVYGERVFEVYKKILEKRNSEHQ